MEHQERDRFLAAAQVAGDLAVHPDVAAGWGRESACAEMSVAGLAHHLASQLGSTVTLLSAGASDHSPIAITDHYARAAWVREGHDGEANAEIREGSDALAAGGPESLPPLVARWLDQLPGVLDSFGSDDPVLIPWQGWSLTARDFLVTRMMEMVVHSDDLAASIDVPPPDFPEEVLTPVLGLLAALSLRRHGQAALVRALSRPQRASGSISAF